MRFYEKDAQFVKRFVAKLRILYKQSSVGGDLSSFSGGGEKASPEFVKFCASLMMSIVDGSDVVVTDRLHVGIAATLISVFSDEGCRAETSELQENGKR